MWYGIKEMKPEEEEVADRKDQEAGLLVLVKRAKLWGFLTSVEGWIGRAMTENYKRNKNEMYW